MKHKTRKLFQNKITAKTSPTHGFGVFAQKKLKKGELIEECYILVCKGNDKKLDDYLFDLGKRKYGVFLGFGCIYNHSDKPNATYTFSVKKRIAKFKATKTIQKGEEIFVSYGYDWFKSRGLMAKE